MIDKSIDGAYRVRKIMASLVVIALTGFIVYALLPYLNAFFGAIILYVLFDPLYLWVRRRKWFGENISAFIVIVVSFLVLTVPVFLAVSLLIFEANSLVSSAAKLIPDFGPLDQIIPGLDLESFLRQQVVTISSFMKDLFVSFFRGVAHSASNILILYFLFYFMLVGYESLAEMAVSLMPFNEKNSRRLAKEFSNVTHSTVVSSGAIAVLQGGILGIGLYMLGVRGAFLWGFIGAILSFLPVLGVFMLWVPMVLFSLVLSDLRLALAIAVVGSIASSADNILRPLIQHRVADIHPLITVVGIFVGVPFFGLTGLVIGPLLLSYSFLVLNMFREEYLVEEPDSSRQKK